MTSINEQQPTERYADRLAALSHVPGFSQEKRIKCPGSVRELAYAQAWETLMTSSPTDTVGDEPQSPIDTVLGYLPYQITQRQATIAATLVSWLGSNGGQELVNVILHNKADRRESETVALDWWYQANRRQPWQNSGFRALEHLLSPVELTQRYGHPPALDVYDYECAEHLMLWLGKDAGRRFVTMTQLAAKQAQYALRAKEHAAWLAERREAPPRPADEEAAHDAQ